jgi:nucleotide-binding universal stress UspA family protein
MPEPEACSGPRIVVGVGADLLLVGRRGHRVFTGAPLGSVSQHCVHRARCSVVVIGGAVQR